MVKKSLVMKNGKSGFDQLNLQPLSQSQGIAIGLIVERCKLTSSIVTTSYMYAVLRFTGGVVSRPMIIDLRSRPIIEPLLFQPESSKNW